jgi:hypothetical protein
MRAKAAVDRRIAKMVARINAKAQLAMTQPVRPRRGISREEARAAYEHAMNLLSGKIKLGEKLK